MEIDSWCHTVTWATRPPTEFPFYVSLHISSGTYDNGVLRGLTKEGYIRQKGVLNCNKGKPTRLGPNTEQKGALRCSEDAMLER